MSEVPRQPPSAAPESDDAGRPEPAVAWQPLTFGGVAALGGAPTARVLVAELVMALLALSAVMALLLSNWFPVIDRAIEALPDSGRIAQRQLQLPWPGPVTLAENSFLGLLVDPSDSRRVSAPADLQVIFRGRQVEFCSLGGCLALSYPAHWIIEFNRTELKPLWGAWRSYILALIGVLTAAALLLVWAVIALCYAPLAYLLAFYSDRALTWHGAWRLGSAALMPGALLLTLALLLYASAVINLLQLGVALVLHVAVGWLYLAVSPCFLPRAAAPTDRHPDSPNPFAPGPVQPLRAPGFANPFARPEPTPPPAFTARTTQPAAEDQAIPASEGSDDDRRPPGM